MTRRACGAGLGLLILAAACTAAPDSRPADPQRAATAPEAASTTTEANDNGRGMREDAADPAAETGAPEPAVPSRTADAAGPFSQPDLWIGAGPPATGLQQPVGPGDLPGPLLGIPSAGVGLFGVYDMCGYTEASFREGGDFPSLVYRLGYDTARRLHKGCSQSRFMAIARSAWVGNEGNERGYFRWRNQAESWLVERRDEHNRARISAERKNNGLSSNVYVHGFGLFSSHSPFGIEFAPWDAPVDEVRVLPGSVAVSGGVLRGLVRNWSRRLWAYGVTVSAGGDEFSWPLSVQPGEVAPFEIHGWDGPIDPEQIGISVTADLSWHADPSRSWGEESGPPLVLRVGGLTRRPLADGVRDRYAHVTGDVPRGSVSVGSVEVLSVPLTPPASHLSLDDVYEDIAVGDLRGYGALFDGHGRVVDVGPAPTVKVTEASGRGVAERFEEVTRLPHPLVVRRHWSHPAAIVEVLFDIHADVAMDDYEFGEPDGDFAATVRFDDEVVEIGDRRFPRFGTLHGGFIIWVGAAHPQLDIGAR